MLIGGNLNSMLQWGPDPQCCTATFNDLPEDVGWGNRASILGDQIYSCGGSKVKKCFRASINGGGWSAVENMKEERYGHTLTTVGDRLVATGGIRTDGRVAETIEIYTDGIGWQTASWSLLMLDYRHCAVAISQNEVLMISGDRESEMKVTMYNINNGEATTYTSPPEATGQAHYCTRDNDYMYVHLHL